MKVQYKLLGEPCNPVNRSEISIEINHDQEAVVNQPRPHVGINNLYFAREDILKVMAYLSNNPGITEGVPFDIEVTERGETETINMYLNLMEGLKRSNDGIEAAVKMLQSLDWLDDKVDGFTFESMYNEAAVSFKMDGITYSSFQEYFDKRCIYIPYVISRIPNAQDAFTALFSMTYLIIEVSRAIKMLVQWATPIAGIGVVIAVAQLVAEIIFFALLLAALIAVMIHLFNCIIQAIKYHGAMLLIDLLKVASHKLGLKFNSSIWETYPFNQIAYLPEKFNPQIEATPSENTVFGIVFGGFAKSGFTSPGYATSAVHDSTTTTVQKGYFNGTGGDLFRLAKKICNGKIIIPDQTNDLLLVRRDYYPATASYQLPAIRQDWNGYNTDELTANIEIILAHDLNDKNCIDKFIGTIFQATHSQIITNDKRLTLLKGLREVQMYAARGVRKEDLNFIEKIHQDLYTAIHVVANAGIVAVNILITAVNVLIVLLDTIITIFNLLANAVIAVIKVVDAIINAISALFGGDGVDPPSWIPLDHNWVHFIDTIPLLPTDPSSYTERIGALLLENDMVDTPKLLLVDITRPEFTASGGYSGQKRIAYLHPQNQNIINSKYLWDNFYFIDAFVGAKHNRFTKISPANNKPGDRNPIVLSVADFKNLVSNPKLLDNYGEEVIADSINWRIGDESGSANIDFRKAGWLKNPQSNNGSERAEEININLQLKTSLPNGQ